MKSKKIFVFAGEESGDVRGSELVLHLRRILPDIVIDAVGGKRMQEAGANIVKDITELALVGFVEVLAHYSFFRRLMSETVSRLSSGSYDALILIDYPGFNLRLAERVKPLGIPVIYYISPQVWAWGKRRVEKIPQLVDRMIVLFDFEKDLYEQQGLDTVFAGHPMVDMVASYKPTDLRKSFSIAEGEKIVGLLPGSRVKEVERILPSMLSAARLCRKEKFGAKLRFIVSAARPDLEKIIRKQAEESGETGMLVYSGNATDVICASDAVVVASGTATLQTCLCGKPMVIVYKTSFLTWAIARVLVTIPFIGMVNVVAGERVVPELVQWQLTGPRICTELTKYFTDEDCRSKVVEGLARVKEKLGSGHAAEKAAAAVADFLSREKGQGRAAL